MEWMDVKQSDAIPYAVRLRECGGGGDCEALIEELAAMDHWKLAVLFGAMTSVLNALIASVASANGTSYSEVAADLLDAHKAWEGRNG